MPETPRGLEVTLISGLRDTDKTRVARALTGGAAVAAVVTGTSETGGRPLESDVIPTLGSTQSEFDVPGAESTEFALNLAEHLCGIACTEPGGHIVVQLEAEADTVDIGFVLEHQFEEQSDDGTTVALRDLVTVASIRDIRQWLFGEDGVQAPIEDAGDQTDYLTPERLALQLEFATTIVLTDIETTPSIEVEEVRMLLFKMNPRARVISLESVPALRRAAGKSGGVTRRLGHTMGWILELAGRVGPATVLDPIGSLVYRDPRPFHPERLSRAIERDLKPETAGLILRSRGVIRLASRPERVGSWSSAGGILTIEPTSMLSWDADSPIGQEIVFFGRDLRREAIAAALHHCVLTTDELLAGPIAWREYRDAFPAWHTDENH